MIYPLSVEGYKDKMSHYYIFKIGIKMTIIDKIKNHPILSVIFIMLLITLCGIMIFKLFVHSTDNSQQYDNLEDQEYLIELEQICRTMTEAQKINFKREGEEMLNYIELELKSDSLNPEERFDKLRSRRLINQELEIINRHLK